MNVLAVIPARAGSRGVPHKNIRLCAGRPLLEWSIEAARAAAHVSRVVVSTDSEAYANIARLAGADVVIRPAALATDTASTDGALSHAMRAVGAPLPDLVVTLQPTVPVRAPGLVDACIRRLLETGADSLLTAYPLHFVWWPAGDSEWAENLTWRTNCQPTRGRPMRQDMKRLETYWHEDGSVYVTRAHLLAGESEPPRRLGGAIQVYATERTVDIDTEADFRVAEAMLWRPPMLTTGRAVEELEARR